MLLVPGHDCVRLTSVSYCGATGGTKDLFPGNSYQSLYCDWSGKEEKNNQAI